MTPGFYHVCEEGVRRLGEQVAAQRGAPAGWAREVLVKLRGGWRGGGAPVRAFVTGDVGEWDEQGKLQLAALDGHQSCKVRECSM